MDTRPTSIAPHILFGMFVLEIFFLFIKKIDARLYAVFDAFEKLYPIIAIVMLIYFLKPRMNRAGWASEVLYE
ncbi:MAG: hypothetical protein AAF353_05230 [Pseudomonadota bacterium]